ncbi:hypothetical protein ACFL27_18810 [candidate division CSSED10-310 bacterium]|uniref:DUF1795 domain-containing protein n=1 Tax=candidate division CSSED10-310 bacterium TaxID=2855610 RepID=A0ABV6Z1D5_UNCC1
MIQHDENVFTNNTLGFEIKKPDDWVFMPSDWAAGFREKNLSDDEKVRQILKMANKPLVAFYLLHDSDEYVYPTVQVICRVVAGKWNRPESLEMQINNLKEVFRNFTLLESSSDTIMAGKLGTKLSATYTLENNEGILFDVFFRNFVVLNGSIAFNIGLSGPVDGPYACETEFDDIISSIKIR